MFSQTIVVEKSDYKNETLVFYAFSDYISMIKDTIAIVNTDENGAFSRQLSLSTIRCVFIDLGVYHCSLYLEPQKVYQLKFPDKRVKTTVEELNIYFEPIEYPIDIVNSSPTDINLLLYSFDQIYDEFLSRNFDSIYRYPQSKITSDFESKINNYYSEINNQYFDEYKNYRIAELKYLGPNRSYETIGFKYFNGEKILYNNFAYMHLFNLMYKDFFNLYANTKEGEKLVNIIREGRSVIKLKKCLENNPSLSDSNLEELIILKAINDELFNPRMVSQIHFPRPQLKIILDSIQFFSSNLEHRKIAENINKKARADCSIKNKISPDFNLLNFSGDTVSLSDFKGKYVYLNFMRTDVVPAMESMDRMINFYKDHQQDIEIVSVFTDDISEFYQLDTTKYAWPLLHTLKNDESILEYYKLITWPQFFLLSAKGMVIASPAPSIQENFEMKFFELIDK